MPIYVQQLYSTTEVGPIVGCFAGQAQLDFLLNKCIRNAQLIALLCECGIFHSSGTQQRETVVMLVCAAFSSHMKSQTQVSLDENSLVPLLCFVILHSACINVFADV